jgi:hypothetical protein
VKMNGLFVYSATKFKIERQIEFLGRGKSVELIEPGERLLEPGIYRFAESVRVTRVNGSAAEAEILPVPNEKGPWPDPPVANKVTSLLGVTRDELLAFFGGSGVQTDLP